MCWMYLYTCQHHITIVEVGSICAIFFLINSWVFLHTTKRFIRNDTKQCFSLGNYCFSDLCRSYCFCCECFPIKCKFNIFFFLGWWVCLEIYVIDTHMPFPLLFVSLNPKIKSPCCGLVNKIQRRFYMHSMMCTFDYITKKLFAAWVIGFVLKCLCYADFITIYQ